MFKTAKTINSVVCSIKLALLLQGVSKVSEMVNNGKTVQNSVVSGVTVARVQSGIPIIN